MLWVCNNCDSEYSVGARYCPQCGKNDYRDEGEPKPEKQTKKDEKK